MPYKVLFSSSSSSLEEELNKLDKKYIIKNIYYQKSDSSSNHFTIVEYADTKQERINKITNILSDENYYCSMVDWIHKMFEHSFQKEWYITYWCFDIHGTILIPNHRKMVKEAVFYPYAEETLQLLTQRKDIKLIISTSSYPEEIEFYQSVFKEKNIIFDYVNENPEIDSTKGNFGYYLNKFYFNVLFEDKAGFKPEKDWKPIYDLLKHYENIKFYPNPQWITKF